MAVRNLTHGTLVIKDGTAVTPLELIVPVMEGDLQWDEVKEAATILNRGKLHSFAEGIETPVEIQFTVTFEEWEGKSVALAAPSVPDALKQRGNAAAWVSTSECGPYTSLLEFTLADPCLAGSGGENEVLSFNNFHCDSLGFREGEEMNTIEVRGKALLVAPTSVRTPTV